MDFLGQKSRVIENFIEVFLVVVEEGFVWRKKGCLCLGIYGSFIVFLQSFVINMVIYWFQLWFYYKIFRDEVQ